MNVGAYPCTRADMEADNVRDTGDSSAVTNFFDNNKRTHDAIMVELTRLGLDLSEEAAALLEKFLHRDVWADTDGRREFQHMDEVLGREPEAEPKTWPHRTTGEACTCWGGRGGAGAAGVVVFV